MAKMEKEEMHYWDVKYPHVDAVFLPRFRIFERDRFLFQYLKGDLRGKMLLEIGCLFPYEVITVINPSKYGYTYVGVDFASEALKAAKRYVPSGMFVRCSATQLPFRKECFDVLLSLGVIHHLSGGCDNIEQLAGVLKNGGLFALTEAVDRGRFSVFVKLTHDSSSPKEGRLTPKDLIRACERSGRIVHCTGNNSLVLGLFSSLIDLFPSLQESRAYLRFVTAIDQFVIKTMRGIGSFFSPGTCFVIIRKNVA